MYLTFGFYIFAFLSLCLWIRTIRLDGDLQVVKDVVVPGIVSIQYGKFLVKAKFEILG